MAIAGGNITLDSTEGMDKITQTDKVTSPYFSNGATTLTSPVSSSLTDTNETYFFGISNSSTPTTEEFNVAFGSTNGYGSLKETNTKAETEAVYKQYASLLLAPTEVTGGFNISNQGSAKAISTRDEEIFVMSARRTNMKDRINKGTWTVNLSGSTSALGNTAILELTDDSVNDSPTATPVGDRYNIVSGSAGTVARAASVKTYGFFYPDMGILVFSRAELSASIPGGVAGVGKTVVHASGSQLGFATGTSTSANTKEALRFVNCLNNGGSMTFRDEEDQVSAQYFCRVRSGQMNFSNNPTFVSGSLNELRQKTMKGNPNTFISSVQLYNDAGDMVAVGNLSTPLKKNFTSEATIKVKLTY
jgi:hypothetical protein